MGGAVLAVLAVLAMLAYAATATAQPNIVVVMTDDQALRDVETMDNVQRTLAARGTTFENFFATFPLCCPSRATFLTGRYAHNHGVLDNIPPDGGYPAFTDAGTAMPVALDTAGYRTGLIGKYLNGYEVDDPIPPGWHVWRAAAGYPNRSYHYDLRFGERVVRYGANPEDYRTDVYARLAVNYLERSHELDRPFFLTVAPGVPHVEGKGRPPTPGPGYDGRFDAEALPRPESFNEKDISDKPDFVPQERLTSEQIASLTELHRRRLASLLPVDRLVERVVETLRSTDELSNTYVIFTSDNGYLLGQHRLLEKTVLYEESVRVPMVIRGPGVPAGASLDQLTGNVDLAPTILDAADAEPLAPVDGHSLLPLAADPTIGWRRQILLENRDSAAIRTRRYMYAEHPGGERELYDLRADPLQLESLHSDPSQGDRIESLSGRLADLRDCAGTECP